MSYTTKVILHLILCPMLLVLHGEYTVFFLQNTLRSQEKMALMYIVKVSYKSITVSFSIVLLMVLVLYGYAQSCGSVTLFW